MKKLIVTKTFEVTTTRDGKIFATPNDIIIISEKGAEYYNVLRVNSINIFSRWMRKSWINAHTKPLTKD